MSEPLYRKKSVDYIDWHKARAGMAIINPQLPEPYQILEEVPSATEMAREIERLKKSIEIKDLLLLEGSQKIDELKASYSRLEDELNRRDDENCDLREGVDRLNDNIERLRSMNDGCVDSENIRLAREIEELRKYNVELSNKLTESTKENMYLRRTFEKDGSQPLEKCIEQAKQLARLDLVLHKERNRIANLEKELEEVPSATEMEREIERLREQLSISNSTIDELRNELSEAKACGVKWVKYSSNKTYGPAIYRWDVGCKPTSYSLQNQAGYINNPNVEVLELEPPQEQPDEEKEFEEAWKNHLKLMEWDAISKENFKKVWLAAKKGETK